MKLTRKLLLGLIAGCAMLLATTAFRAGAVPLAASSDQPFVVEYYYKAKWGYADEFIRLFKKNHLPLLLREIQAERILQVSAVAPRYHGTEDARWDYRVTIVFRNAAAAAEAPDRSAWIRDLNPDRAAYDKEEQRRFEILLAHWDLPIVPVKLD
jgi:hypothetical protein